MSSPDARAPRGLPFVKMHGAGNDYVYVDVFEHPVDDPATLAPLIADRRTGVGGDGLILVEPSDQADARMRIFNADGSEAETCGNGLRCVVKLLHDRRRLGPRCRIETGAGIVEAAVIDPPSTPELDPSTPTTVAVEMGRPRWAREDIPMTGSGPAVDIALDVAERIVRVTALGLGNPHCVVFVDDLESFPVAELGQELQRSHHFPASVNVEFVQIEDGTTIRQRTYERGSGETWACGSGAVAAAVAAITLEHVQSPVTVHLRGGTLVVRYQADGVAVMEGPAIQVFEGVFPLPTR